MNIPSFIPSITEKEIERVTEVLRGKWLSQGRYLNEFEQRIAEKCNRKYAIGVNSGTSALHIVLMALGIKEGDEVITTPYTFIATANSILYVGAKPVFVDINPKTHNIDARSIEKYITKKTKAILAVEAYGNTSGFFELLEIAKKNNLYLIEDSCEALGAVEQNRAAGSFGICSVLGFFPNKQVTTGEGGMILTDDEEIMARCMALRNHGKDIDGKKFIDMGYNFKLSEINAALGIEQVKRLDLLLKQRETVYDTYNSLLQDVNGVNLPNKLNESNEIVRSIFKYVVWLNEDFTRLDRDEIINLMSEKGISCDKGFLPVHLQNQFTNRFGYKNGDFPNCEFICDRAISLPFYPDLEHQAIKYVVENLSECLKKIKIKEFVCK